MTFKDFLNEEKETREFTAEFDMITNNESNNLKEAKEDFGFSLIASSGHNKSLKYADSAKLFTTFKGIKIDVKCDVSKTKKPSAYNSSVKYTEFKIKKGTVVTISSSDWDKIDNIIKTEN